MSSPDCARDFSPAEIELIRRLISELGPAGKQSVPVKDIWVYPLTRDFRAQLTRP